MTDHELSSNLFGLPEHDASQSDFIILPLPYEGTVSYGSGASEGPQAVLDASEQVEVWDDEVHFELDSLKFHTAKAIVARVNESTQSYLARVQKAAATFMGMNATVIGVGGEHSLTPPLVRAAIGSEDLSDLTVVQIDAHTDLRDEYDGTPCSHACAMRRVTEAGAALIAIGIRAISKEEWEYAAGNPVTIHRAQDLATKPKCFSVLLEEVRSLTGDVYLTIDMDGLAPSLCPGTGTPEPGGLEWYPTLQILRSLLVESRAHVIGMDFVETAPMPSTQVNEFTTARLISKAISYSMCERR